MECWDLISPIHATSRLVHRTEQAEKVEREQQRVTVIVAADTVFMKIPA